MKPKFSMWDRLQQIKANPSDCHPAVELLLAAAKESREKQQPAETDPQGNPLPLGQRALRRAARAAAKTPINVRDGDYLFRDDGTGKISIEQRGKVIEHPSKGLCERAMNALDRAQAAAGRPESAAEQQARWGRGEYLPNELDPDRPMLEQLEERAANGDEKTRKMLEMGFYTNPEIMSLFHDTCAQNPDNQQAQPPSEQRNDVPVEPQGWEHEEQHRVSGAPSNIAQLIEWAAQSVANTAHARKVPADLTLVHELLAPHHDAQLGAYYGTIARRASGKLRFEIEAAQKRNNGVSQPEAVRAVVPVTASVTKQNSNIVPAKATDDHGGNSMNAPERLASDSDADFKLAYGRGEKIFFWYAKYWVFILLGGMAPWALVEGCGFHAPEWMALIAFVSLAASGLGLVLLIGGVLFKSLLTFSRRSTARTIWRASIMFSLAAASLSLVAWYCIPPNDCELIYRYYLCISLIVGGLVWLVCSCVPGWRAERGGLLAIVALLAFVGSFFILPVAFAIDLLSGLLHKIFS